MEAERLPPERRGVVHRFIADFIAEVRQLSRRQVVAAELGLILILASGPLGNSVGIVLLPLGLLLIVASFFLARSALEAVQGLALMVFTFAAVLLLALAVGLSCVALDGSDDDAGGTGEVTPTR